MQRRLLLMALLIGFLFSSTGTTARAQPEELCFAEVPDCISGRFAEYWQQNGGLAVFGFPIGPAVQETINGNTYLVQPFERNRFELHPENPRPYDVLLGRLGDDRLRQMNRPWEAEPKAESNTRAGCVYFDETQHLVCDAFLAYWRSNGLNIDGQPGFTSTESLALFGLPLTEATIEVGSDGNPYLTQWFERARFELHPEIGPNAVLLGLLGREITAPPPAAEPPDAPAPEPAPAPEATCRDVPTTTDGTVTPPCFLGGEIFIATANGFEPGKTVNFSLRTPGDVPVELGIIYGPARTDANGSYPLKAALNVNTPPGIYELRMTSGRTTKILAFRIDPYELGSPPFDNSQIPPSVNATVSQTIARRGTQLSFKAEGFEPGETVALSGIEPDGRVIQADFTLRAGRNGIVDEGRLRQITSDEDPVGIYETIFTGLSSGHTARAYFRLIP